MSAMGIGQIIGKPFGDIYDSFKDEIKTNTHIQELNEVVDELEKQFLDVVKVKTIYKGDKAIDLNTFYVPTKVIVDGNVEKVNLINEIPSNFIVLEGTVGQGKSIFMRYLTFKEAKSNSSKPIFFELKNLKNNTLQDSIKKILENWIDIFQDDDFDYLINSNKFSLFLDGFDEIPGEQVPQVILELENWCKKYPNLRITISSRPDSDIQNSTYFDVYRLMPYGLDEQFQLVEKLISRSEKEARDSLKKSIRESEYEIQELLKTPLMVTLYVMKFRANLNIPTNQSEFYNDLFQVLSSRHDKTKPGYKREFKSKFHEIELQKVFEAFCFIAGNRKKLAFTTQEALDTIEIALKDSKLSASPNSVLEDFTKVVCLLLRDGNDYTFIHRSIQEFYYALYIFKREEAGKLGFYNELNNSKFIEDKENILNFLEEIDKYYYFKHYAQSSLKKIIAFFEIEKDQNDFMKKIFYTTNKVIDNEIIIFLNDELVIYDLDIFSIRKKIFELIWSNNLIPTVKTFCINSSSISDKYKDNIEKIEKFLLENNCDKIIASFKELGNEILDYEKKMQELISERSSINFYY